MKPRRRTTFLRVTSSVGVWLLALLLAGCSSGASEVPELMVPLSTVQSGPAIQAEELNGAIARQPRNASLYAHRAEFRLAAGQVEAALRDLNQALELDDAPGEFYYLKARALRAQGQLAGTLAAAAEASRHGYASPALSLLVGEAHLAARHYSDALDHLDRALRQEPANAGALFYKGLAYSGLRDTAQALAMLQASVRLDPRQPESLHQLAFLANANHQPLLAAPYAARGLRLAPTYGPLHYDYGRQFDLLGLPDSAQRHFQRALRYDTTLYRADYRVALALFRQRQYQAAIPHLRRALRRSVLLPNARQMLAESYEAQGQHDLALVEYQRLVQENPGNRHWTYKVWKGRARAQGQPTETPRRAAVEPVAPLNISRPSSGL
ncbi:tetratricopeptide repeat protein [Hymenobacter guriensis]|uniref:Tetratricopeptide repeat protein n=1 Tax=Hymenobacter guriensis TaxID=2793065 RepID=A0ABS0L3H1_9BACT|nr:tetratricopeptide repeat protein [Hymenobacter guriensis]MBG8554675.1 tetratricopeptide repeat protein [Hymenobacter guriensis]